MADHGRLINSRTYWTTTDAKGKQVVVDTPPKGPDRPFGIGSTAAPSSQYQEQTYEDGTKILSRWDPEAGQWVQESVDVDTGIQSQANQARQEARTEASAAATASGRDAATAEAARHNRATEAAAANANARGDVRAGQQQKIEDRRVTLAEQAQKAEEYWRQLNAEVAAGRMRLEERNQKFKEYQAGVEADIAKQHLALQQQSEVRVAANQGRQATLGEAEFGRGVGRDAMGAAEKRYLYQREAAYARAKAAGKSPEQAMNESAQTEVPDFDALAAAAAQKAVNDLRGLSSAPGGMPPPAGAPAGGAAAPSAVLAAQQPAQAVTGTPATRDQWAVG